MALLTELSGRGREGKSRELPAFGFRPSDFFRPSTFGFRISGGIDLCHSRSRLLKCREMKLRRAKVRRVTRETRIGVTLNIDGVGKASVQTGIPFFDHMLELFAKHAVVGLTLRCEGDLAVDGHHTVEDCGIALGQAFAAALGDKRGIRRYGAGF